MLPFDAGSSGSPATDLKLARAGLLGSNGAMSIPHRCVAVLGAEFILLRGLLLLVPPGIGPAGLDGMVPRVDEKLAFLSLIPKLAIISAIDFSSSFFSRCDKNALANHKIGPNR